MQNIVSHVIHNDRDRPFPSQYAAAMEDIQGRVQMGWRVVGYHVHSVSRFAGEHEKVLRDIHGVTYDVIVTAVLER
jgi:predicted lipoprotein with Yx(FWY)xxD motif